MGLAHVHAIAEKEPLVGIVRTLELEVAGAAAIAVATVRGDPAGGGRTILPLFRCLMSTDTAPNSVVRSPSRPGLRTSPSLLSSLPCRRDEFGDGVLRFSGRRPYSAAPSRRTWSMCARLKGIRVPSLRRSGVHLDDAGQVGVHSADGP